MCRQLAGRQAGIHRRLKLLPLLRYRELERSLPKRHASALSASAHTPLALRLSLRPRRRVIRFFPGRVNP